MKAPVSDDLSGTLLHLRYAVVAPIGSGATARVYLANDRVLHRRVALKVLHAAAASDAKYVDRFRSEAMLVAQLAHPHIMHVFDAVMDEERPFLVLEFLGGGSLRSLLDAGERLSVSQALEVGLGAAKALNYANERGFIHRDIKPANLLFGEEGRLRVADFGMARALAEASWTEPEGMMLGTAKYASPEQATGEPLTGKSDVYSLALVLIEAVTGQSPFPAESPMETLRARIDSDLEVPAELGRLRPTLEWATRLHPADRCAVDELELSLLAAAPELDRPRPLPLTGAIPVEVLEERLAAIEELDDDPTVPMERVQPDHPSEGVDPTPPIIDIPIDDPGPRRRRRWPYVLATLLMIATAVGGTAYWYFAVRTPLVVVPELVGMRSNDAKAQLEEQGFVVAVKTVRRDGTAPDQVVEQLPTPGDELARGTSVELTISLGPTLVAVPVISAEMTEEQASAELAALGLLAGAVTEANDENVAKDHVISAVSTVSPDALGMVPKGTKVDIVVSLGPALRTIPSGLVGETSALVQKKLTSLGLKTNVSETYDNDIPSGSVVALSKVANSQVPRGTTIEVVVSKGPEPIPLTDVRGKTGIQATTILQAAGFRVTEIAGPPGNAVLITEPAPGTKVPRNTGVRIVTSTQ